MNDYFFFFSIHNVAVQAIHHGGFTSEFVAGPRPLILVSDIPGNCSAWENEQNDKWKSSMGILVLTTLAKIYNKSMMNHALEHKAKSQSETSSMTLTSWWM